MTRTNGNKKNEPSSVLFFVIKNFHFFSTIFFFICAFCAFCIISVWVLIRHLKQKTENVFLEKKVHFYVRNGRNDFNVLPLTGPEPGFKKQILFMRIIVFLVGTLWLEEFWSVFFFSCWNQMVEFAQVIQKKRKK